MARHSKMREFFHTLLWLKGGLLVGGVGFYARGPLLATLGYWWDQTGVVLLALLPMTGLLVGIALFLVADPSPRQLWVRRGLQVVSYAAPSTGLLGTVLGVMEGTAAFNLQSGVEGLLEAVSQLMAGLNTALISTAWGTSLAVFAGIGELLVFGNEPEAETARRTRTRHQGAGNWAAPRSTRPRPESPDTAY